jgi:TRAP-type mannitol/chloroaromatic compound transport system permease small subunit
MAAWQDARRLVSANADVLMAIAGVFFLLPLLALAVFVDPPAVTAQMTQAQLAQSMQDYYLRNAPVILPLSLVPIVGFIAMLVCMLDRSRPPWAKRCAIVPRACRPISPRRSWSACLPPC